MTRTQLALTAVVALALVALAVALPAAAATDGATTARTQANETQPPNGSFDRSIYDVRKGEVVAIDVSLANTDNATIVIGGQEKEYELRANVTDGNGDGKVQLQFDTASPDSESALATFRDADSVTVVSRNGSSGEFVGSYGMTLSYNGTRLDAAAMAVQPAQTTTSTTTPTTTSTTTASMDPTDTTTSDGQPGFGVTVTFVAVVAAAAAAARR